MYFWNFICYYGSNENIQKKQNIKAYFDENYEIKFIEKNESGFLYLFFKIHS
jgi:hypothetical protein